MSRKWLGRIFATLIVFSLAPMQPAPALAALPQPPQQSEATQAAQADASAVELLRDTLYIGAQMDRADHFIIGGGFLYWASCPSGGPRAAGEGSDAAAQPDAPAEEGYLRRISIYGGAYPTLQNSSFCAYDSWAADDAGLFFWGGGWLWRVTTAAPTVQTRITSTPSVEGRVALDGTYLYWITGTQLWRVPKWDTANSGGDRSEYVAETSTAARSLLISGSRVYWLDSVGLRSVARDCSEVCSVSTLASGNGNYLTDAYVTLGGGGYSSPLWTPGVAPANTLVGHTCLPSPGGILCLLPPTTYYSAPNRNDSNGNNRQAYLGAADDNGAYLYWVENLRGNPGEVTADGRLMKWKLNRSVVGDTNPFVTPQPIAQKTAQYSLLGGNRDDHVQVADGWVYFMTSGGVSRIRADAPPLRWDVAFRYMETNQVVQSVLNEAPLVANKPTVVRVYPNKLEGPELYNVSARLIGTRADGSPLPGSPLRPSNGSIDLLTNNAPVDSATLDGSWLFTLPNRWIGAGQIKLRAEIDPSGIVNDPNRANNNSANNPFTFTGKQPICIVAVPVRTHGGPASTQDRSLFISTEVLRQLFPTNDVWLYAQSSDVAQIQARIGIPPWKYTPYALPGDGENVLRALRDRALLSDDPDACDDAGATIHYIGLISSPTPTDGQGGLGCVDCSLGELVAYFKLPNQADAALASRLPPLGISRSFGTLAHEVGHTLGRLHVDCGGPKNPDPNWPYKSSPCRFSERYAGFDTTWTEPVMPIDEFGREVADLMGYATFRWMSDYTYGALFNRISGAAAASSEAAAAQAEMVAAGGVIYLSGSVGVSQPTGSLGYAWNYPTAQISQGVLAKLASVAAPAVQEAALDANAWHVVLLNQQGGVLTDRAVTPAQSEDGPPPTQLPFTLAIPAVQGVARIELRNGTTVVASRTVSPKAPMLRVVAPAGGESFDQSMTLTWEAADGDGDPLLFNFQYSRDQGQHWQTFLSSYPKMTAGNQMTLALADINEFPATTTGSLIRIAVSDGFNTTLATSNPFTVPNRKPVVSIAAPGAGAVFQPTQTILLKGAATDVEDGGLNETGLLWRLNGYPIGAGASVSVDDLPPGDYSALLTATDSKGAEGSATTTFTVAPLTIPTVATSPKLDGNCNEAAYSAGTQVLLAPYANVTRVPVSMVGDANGLWLCFAGMARTGGTSPGTIIKVRMDGDFSHQATLAANDRVYFLNEGAVVSSFIHNGTTYVGGPSDAVGQVSSTPTMWTGELFINKSAFGGWDHLVGLGVEQASVNAVIDAYGWPLAMNSESPATWSPALLGALPEVTALEPSTATAGSGALTLRVAGSGFVASSVLLWNGQPRPTVVISGGRLEAQIPASDLASAATAMIHVRNYGLAQATSGSVPFVIENRSPAISNAVIANGLLQIAGTNFSPGAQIVFNGFVIAPGSLAGNQATAQLTAAQVAMTDTPGVTVLNPQPGGGASNVFTIGGAPLPPPGSIRVSLPIVRK